jgi:hypothetical protein
MLHFLDTRTRDVISPSAHLRGEKVAPTQGPEALATPLSLMVNFPLWAPLKVPLVIHSINAALTVECGPAHGCPGTPP